MKWISCLCLSLITVSSVANEKILNIYNWANYLPTKVIRQFEHATGIKINYMEYDSNETLYAKLKADPNIGFDIIVPSSYYIPLMKNQGMLRPLSKNLIPNLKYLNPLLLHKKFDKNNNYSLPYTWGITGIAVNDLYHSPQQITHWRDLWNKRYRNQLLMLDDMREVFSIALITLGYSVNDTNPQHIKRAYEKLRQLMPNIKLFNSDAAQNIYVDEDATIGMGYTGDIFEVQQENSHVQFIYPKDPFVLWIDCVAIPRHAPHYKNALVFINFINQPKIAAEIAISNGYPSPNLAAKLYLPHAMQISKTLNPSNETLQRGVIENDVGNATTLYEKYWQLLKLGS